MATDVNGRESAEQTPERPGAPTDPQTASGGLPGTHHEAPTPDAPADFVFTTLIANHPDPATASRALAMAEAAVLRRAADALNALPQDYECDPGWGDAAERLRRTADGVETGWNRPETSAPDFFQPGHTYARENHASTIRFLVRYIDDSPEGIPYRVAFGWRTEDGDVCASPFDSDDFEGWTDVTTVYPVGGENAQETTR